MPETIAQHPNVRLARRFFTAFAERDRAALVHLLAPDAIWIVAGRSPVAGGHAGADAILRYSAKLRQDSGATYRVDAIDTLTSEFRVVLYAKGSAMRDGRLFEWRFLILLRVARGLVVEGRVFVEDQTDFDEFWS